MTGFVSSYSPVLTGKLHAWLSICSPSLRTSLSYPVDTVAGRPNSAECGACRGPQRSRVHPPGERSYEIVAHDRYLLDPDSYSPLYGTNGRVAVRYCRSRSHFMPRYVLYRQGRRGLPHLARHTFHSLSHRAQSSLFPLQACDHIISIDRLIGAMGSLMWTLLRDKK